jgi:integrase
MPVIDLNARNWDTLECEPGKRETIWWSGKVSGFGLRCRDTGGRSAVVQARPLTSCRSLGDARALGFANALKKATQQLSLIRLGETPLGQRDGIAVDELITRYLAHQEPRVRASTMRELRRHLLVDARSLHARRSHQIGQRDVVALLQGIAARAPVSANRTRVALSGMFAWGMKAGLVKTNPVAATFVPSPEAPRSRVLSDAELALVWAATNDGGNYSKVVRLALLTGARRQEVAGIRESEITRHADGSATWVLPGARAKNHRPNELVLPPMIAALLPEPRDDGPLFGRGVSGLSGWTKRRQQLDARIAEVAANDGGEMPCWRLHDLRRTFVTRLNDLGIEPHVIEALINHVSGLARAGVAGVYNLASYRAQKHAALIRWCAHIIEITSTAPVDEGANIVALRRPW